LAVIGATVVGSAAGSRWTVSELKQLAAVTGPFFVTSSQGFDI